jgi:hypothetical protein
MIIDAIRVAIFLLLISIFVSGIIYINRSNARFLAAMTLAERIEDDEEHRRFMLMW